MLQGMFIQLGKSQVLFTTYMALVFLAIAFIKAYMHFKCKCIAHLLAANRTFISLTLAVVTSNMRFELLSVLQGLLAKPANSCAWNYMGHHHFNPLILVDLAGIYPKTPQHIYLLIMALLKFLLETWFRLGLGLRLRLCGCSSRGIATQSLVWKLSSRDEITEITSGVDSVGFFGEIIPWCQSYGVGPQIL